MSCPQKFCVETCESPCEVKDCVDEHLTTYCPPSCLKCSETSCASSYGASNSCVSSCGPSSCCMSICDFSPNCTNPTNVCNSRYEILKHTVRCAPNPNCPTRCVQRSRASYKPVQKCEIATSMPCYETIYMRAFNTPEACCPNSCCTATPCQISSCCTDSC